MTPEIQTTDLAVVQQAPPPAFVELSTEVLSSLVNENSMTKLTDAQRLAVVQSVCQHIGIPVELGGVQVLELNKGRHRLYFTAECADFLRHRHRVTCQTVNREVFEGMYLVTVRVSTPDGRGTEATGAVVWPTVPSGRDNAIMKAETKAMRRATFKHIGLGIGLGEEDVEEVRSYDGPRYQPVTAELSPAQESVIAKRTPKMPSDDDKAAFVALFDHSAISMYKKGFVEQVNTYSIQELATKTARAKEMIADYEAKQAAAPEPQAATPTEPTDADGANDDTLPN